MSASASGSWWGLLLLEVRAVVTDLRTQWAVVLSLWVYLVACWWWTELRMRGSRVAASRWGWRGLVGMLAWGVGRVWRRCGTHVWGVDPGPAAPGRRVDLGGGRTTTTIGRVLAKVGRGSERSAVGARGLDLVAATEEEPAFSGRPDPRAAQKTGGASRADRYSLGGRGQQIMGARCFSRGGGGGVAVGRSGGSLAHRRGVPKRGAPGGAVRSWGCCREWCARPWGWRGVGENPAGLMNSRRLK